MTQDLENRIRKRAFGLWEGAGYPENKAEEFWLLAEKIERDGLDPTAKLSQAPGPANPIQFAGA